MSASYKAGYEAGKARLGHISAKTVQAKGYDLADFVRGYRAGWND